MTNIETWRLSRKPGNEFELMDDKQLIEEYCCSCFVNIPGDDNGYCAEQLDCYTCWRSECGRIDSATVYQRLALRTAKSDQTPEEQLTEALMGLCGESGEALDILKKHKFQGHELDKESLMKELGDVAWYLTIGAHALGYDLSEVLMANIEKLRHRYPNGFEAERSVNRNV